MSRSKRTAQVETPAPQGNWLRDARGGVRAGWLLTVSLLACALIGIGVRWGLGRGFAALFDAWGVNASTAHRAPAWARLFWRWQGSVVTVLVSALLLAASAGLRRLWRGNRPIAFRTRELLLAALSGLALAATVLLLGLLPDSLRREAGPPRFSPGLLALCAVSLLAVLAEEAFTKRVLYDGLAPRWGRLWATAASCAVFFAMNGGYAGNVPCAINVLLLGLLICRVYERYGLWADVGLRWGWSFATVFLLGFGGGEASLLRFYGVSETLLTGGDAGPVYGLYLTAALAIAVCCLEWKHKKVLHRMFENKTN